MSTRLMELRFHRDEHKSQCELTPHPVCWVWGLASPTGGQAVCYILFNLYYWVGGSIQTILFERPDKIGTPKRMSSLKMKEKKGFTPLEVSLLEEEPTSKLKEDFRLKSRLLTGFTLIELMLVTIIVAVLALVGGVRFGDTVRVTRIRRAKAEIQALAVALRSFHMDCGQYPYQAGYRSGPWPGAALDDRDEWFHVLVAGTTSYLGTEDFEEAKKYWAGPYISKTKLDPWGKPYIFRDYSHPEDVRLSAVLCTGKDGGLDIQWTAVYREKHPPNPRDGIAICYPDDPPNKNVFDIVYWME